MNQWDEMSRQHPPHIWYPPLPYPTDSTFLGVKEEAIITQRPYSIPEHGVTERAVATANIWPLMPAIVGTGTSFLLLLMLNHKTWRSKEDTTRSDEECPMTRKASLGSAVVVLNSLLATAGISYYVFSVLTASDGPIITAFLPVSAGISILILYFASAFALQDHLDPGSFSGENIGDDIVSRLNTFVYFSITTFSTAGGDLAPVNNASRILVAIEVLFFVFIFTMGIVFFPKT
ncbi:ion channel [Desulfitobacterium metallireducens]|uniref:Multidrug ABC transporter ATPase n=1 Tax=Desulfitobacterium metallireducens DSM 15288 TaxID=871968 RepID=W0E9Q0_9FIRM|nr:ion channel [Desulfitobacterium metallireducens]AHF06238.1 multidrug ABC transporter ATPase [Desulfitobacterium metallireducens DSM 15288]